MDAERLDSGADPGQATALLTITPVNDSTLEDSETITVTLQGGNGYKVDGVATRSCGISVSEASGKQITTIEGLAANGVLHKVQLAWIENDVPQCGYCQSGMIMAVAALLKDKPKPTDQDIDEAITNICRCGTFQQVREAIHAATSV